MNAAVQAIIIEVGPTTSPYNIPRETHKQYPLPPAHLTVSPHLSASRGGWSSLH